MDASALRRAIERELNGNLLPFWRQRSLDERHGGFIAEMANNGALREDAAKGLILTTRILWAFSTLFAERGDPVDLALARRAFDYLESRFRDRDHGGYLWRVDPHGRELDATKKVYGQAFAIYALSAYHAATGESDPLAAARELYRLIHRHAYDNRYGGYLEARAADWTESSELRLSDKDMIAPKSMNTHLHLLEAYSGLHRVWPDADVARRLAELIDIFGRHIRSHCGLHRGHLHLFFDADWGVCSDSYSYGHDIEAAWLLCEAAEVLGEESRLRAVREWAIEMGNAVLTEAIDADGGLAYEGRNGSVIDGNREWWCQAEAVVGFWQIHELTGEEKFASATGHVWQFISNRVVDRTGGEWYWRVRRDGTIDQSEPKVSEWKGPYHTTRMCLEMMRRLGVSAREIR